MNQPQLAEHLLREITRAQLRLEAAVADLSPDQLNWKPDPKSWSILQVADHLVRTDSAYYPQLEKLLQSGRPLASPNRATDYESGWVGKKFIQMVDEGGKPLKNPALFSPAASGHSLQMLQDYRQALGWWQAHLPRLGELSWRRNKMFSPALPLLRARMGDFILALVGHHHRHLSQMGRIRQMLKP